MTARIAGFVTRDAAGLTAPRSVSRNVDPRRGGTALHYGGPPQPAARSGAAHTLCVSTWRAWQTFHKGPSRGWSDIAYSGGFCNHGFALAGRGYGVRTAANGTNDGNDRFLAVCWIGGEGQVPTQLALDAAEWWVAEFRFAGAGSAVKSHHFFKDTACSGPYLTEHARRLDGRPTTLPHIAPSPDAPSEITLEYAMPPIVARNSLDEKTVKKVQGLLIAHGANLTQDGDFGPATASAVLRHKQAWSLPGNSTVDAATWRTLIEG